MNVIWGILSLLIRLAWPLLVIMRWLWDLEVDFLMRITVGLRRRAVLPPVFNPLLLLPATVLAENIRQRKMTSVEIVRAFVTRCSDVNPLLNAIVRENFQHALQFARETDERIITAEWLRKGLRKVLLESMTALEDMSKGYRDESLSPEKLKEEEPFLGVPFTVQETISVEGFPQTAGLLMRLEETAHKDAVVVQRMKDAGAILLATTNIPELGMWWECSNPLYGRTNNPYDTRRTSGGSSGGEAALMCSCGSPLSIGTDTGGSIRTPAFFCGLFGHKPTAGIIPLTGCTIDANREDNITVQVAGPLTRHATDITPVLKILTGPDERLLNLDQTVHLGVLKFYSAESDNNGVTTSLVAGPLRKTQRDIAKHLLEKYDLDVVKVRIPDLQNAYSIWQEKMKEDYAERNPMHKRLVNNQGEINIWTEMIRAILGRARYSFASLLQVAIEKGTDELKFLRDQKNLLEGKTTSGPSMYISKWRQLKMKIQRLLGEDGVLLFPSHPTLAPFHRGSYFKPLNFSYTAIFNALGFPVTQVPLGLDQESGLPLGIQVVGGMYMDRLTIAVAQELEVAFGGWKCPAKIL